MSFQLSPEMINGASSAMGSIGGGADNNGGSGNDKSNNGKSNNGSGNVGDPVDVGEMAEKGGGGFGDGVEQLYSSQGDTWTKYLNASKEMQTLRKKKEESQQTPANEQKGQLNVNVTVDKLNKDKQNEQTDKKQ